MATQTKTHSLLHLAEAVRDTGYAFVTVTPATHQRVNARPQNAWAKNLRDVFGWSRPFKDDAAVPADLFRLMEEAEVLTPCNGGWRSKVRFSSLDGSLFVHSAYPTTAADSVFFGPDTYRFASAISSYVRRRKAPVRRALDVGCGAGPGGILLAKHYPDAEVVLSDINAAALDFAQVNADLARTRGVKTIQSDLFAGIDGAFDLIVANPPYLNDETLRAYRHGGGDLGSALSLAILEQSIERLTPSGALLLYTGAPIVDGVDPFRAAAAASLNAREAAWTYEEIDPDVFGEELDHSTYAGVERIAAVVLTATIKGSA